MTRLAQKARVMAAAMQEPEYMPTFRLDRMIAEWRRTETPEQKALRERLNREWLETEAEIERTMKCSKP